MSLIVYYIDGTVVTINCGWIEDIIELDKKGEQFLKDPHIIKVTMCYDYQNKMCHTITK